MCRPVPRSLTIALCKLTLLILIALTTMRCSQPATPQQSTKAPLPHDPEQSSIIVPASSGGGQVLALSLNASGPDAPARPIRLNVYLPPDYADSEDHYPTVYLLHGGGSTPNSWVYNSQIAETMDALIAGGEIRPMILVMPPAYDFAETFEDAFYGTVLPHIDAAYRTDARRSMRAIGGPSVGGGLTLWTGLRHPELFSALGVWMYGNVADLPLSRESLLDNLTPETTPAIYLRIGDQDGFLRHSISLHEALLARNIAHFFQVDPDGWHNFAYFNPLIPDYLRWFSTNFDASE